MTKTREVAAVARVREEIAGRVDARLDELTAAILGAFRSDIPAYAALDDAVLGEVRTTTRLSLALIVKAIAEDTSLEAHALPLLRELARRRGEQGVSLQALMRAYQIGTRVGLEFVLEEMEGMEIDPRLGQTALGMMVLSILRLTEQLTGAAAAAFE